MAVPPTKLDVLQHAYPEVHLRILKHQRSNDTITIPKFDFRMLDRNLLRQTTSTGTTSAAWFIPLSTEDVPYVSISSYHTNLSVRATASSNG